MIRNLKTCNRCQVNGSIGHYNNKHTVTQRKELSEEVLRAIGATRCGRCYDLYAETHICGLQRYRCPECPKSLILSGLIRYHLPKIHGIIISQEDFLEQYGHRIVHDEFDVKQSPQLEPSEFEFSPSSELILYPSDLDHPSRQPLRPSARVQSSPVEYEFIQPFYPNSYEPSEYEGSFQSYRS